MGEYSGVADAGEAGDAGVLNARRHDAVDLAVQADGEGRVAVDHVRW
ncbi:hypothetical protein [Streptomyces sp. NPDC096153]